MRILFLSGKKGFTLAELLVSMFIIAIIAAAFLPIFTMSIANIYNAGNRTEEVFNTQKNLEKDFSNKNTSITASSLKIELSNNDTLAIHGNDISGASIRMFLPRE